MKITILMFVFCLAHAVNAEVLPIASGRRDGLEKLPRPVFGSVEGKDPMEGDYKAYEKANQNEFAPTAEKSKAVAVAKNKTNVKSKAARIPASIKKSAKKPAKNSVKHPVKHSIKSSKKK